MADLRACADGQNAVAQGLQTSETEATEQKVAEAVEACHSAAHDLRQWSPPTVNGTAAADAVDQMADGLNGVKSGLSELHTHRSRARRLAQAGMRRYAAGLARLTAAEHAGA